MFNLPAKLIEVFPELYAVGGCVRDRLMNIQPKDYDFASALLPEEVIERAKKANLKVVATGIEHGTVTVFVDRVGHEITTFRKDISCDGRNATVEFSKSIHDDLSRRDFTINAIALDLKNGTFITANDFCLSDLSAKVMRTVGNPYDRFREDYLRIIRLARFAARFNFIIDEKTLTAAKQLAPEVLKHVSPERIFMEFNKAFEHDRAGTFIRLLTEFGLFTLIFPEYEKFDTMEQDSLRHPEGPVSEHVYQVVERAIPQYRWHALLHDVGKPAVYKQFWKVNPKGTVGSPYYEHDTVGADLIDGIADRLKFPTNLRESIKNTTKFHMYPVMMLSNGFSARTCRRFQAKVLPFIDELKAVVMADKGEGFRNVACLFEPLETPIKPILLGRHLIERGVSPCAKLGIQLKKAYQAQIEEGITDLELLAEIALKEE